MTTDYEAEQKTLGMKISDLRETFAKSEEQNQDIKRFVKLVRNTIQPQKLTSEMVRELLDRIELGRISRCNGHCEQEVKLFYRFFGEIERK